MKCPKCDAPLSVTHSALDSERLTFTIDFEGDMIMARTVGACITEIQKILVFEGRRLGLRSPAVFVTSITLEPHKFTVGLLNTSKARKAR